MTGKTTRVSLNSRGAQARCNVSYCESSQPVLGAERSLRRVPVLGHEPRSRRHQQARGRVRPRPPDRQDRAREREQRRQARRRGPHRQRQQRAGDQRRRPLRRLPLGGLESRPRRYEPHLRHLRPRPQDPPNALGSASAAAAGRRTARTSAASASAPTAATWRSPRWRRTWSRATPTTSPTSSSAISGPVGRSWPASVRAASRVPMPEPSVSGSVAFTRGRPAASPSRRTALVLVSGRHE